METENSRLDRDYERAKARNDWQGMAAAHALRMRNREREEQQGSEKESDFLVLGVALGILGGLILSVVLYGWVH